jgi:hypothetical protein
MCRTPVAAAVTPTKSPRARDGEAEAPAAETPSKCILAERFKTKMCQNYEKTGVCPYEVRCMFAHGPGDLRTKEMNYRDRLTTDEAIKNYQRVRMIAQRTAEKRRKQAAKRAAEETPAETPAEAAEQGAVAGPAAPRDDEEVDEEHRGAPEATLKTDTTLTVSASTTTAAMQQHLADACVGTNNSTPRSPQALSDLLPPLPPPAGGSRHATPNSAGSAAPPIRNRSRPTVAPLNKEAFEIRVDIPTGSGAPQTRRDNPLAGGEVPPLQADQSTSCLIPVGTPGTFLAASPTTANGNTHLASPLACGANRSMTPTSQTSTPNRFRHDPYAATAPNTPHLPARSPQKVPVSPLAAVMGTRHKLGASEEPEATSVLHANSVSDPCHSAGCYKCAAPSSQSQSSRPHFRAVATLPAAATQLPASYDYSFGIPRCLACSRSSDRMPLG